MASSLQLRYCPQLKREDHWKLCSQSGEAANANSTAILGSSINTKECSKHHTVLAGSASWRSVHLAISA